MHRRHARDGQFPRNGVAHFDAAHAVAPGVKGGTGNDYLGSERTQNLENRLQRFFLVLVEIIIAIIDRADDVSAGRPIEAAARVRRLQLPSATSTPMPAFSSPPKPAKNWFTT